MNTEQTFRVEKLTLDELATLKYGVRELAIRWFRWRHQPGWRDRVREAISAYRKLQFNSRRAE